MRKKNCKFIVTTTIYKPSLAMKKFSNFKDWNLIVVGDKKTPHDYYKFNKKLIYLSPSDQVKIDKKLSSLIGWNCIQRRNFGYILAYKLGADIVATVDDDNVPLNNWGKDLHLNKKKDFNYFKTNLLVFDPLSIFKFKKRIWHRGYPVELLKEEQKLIRTKKILKPDVQANLWNFNPDIDAFNRACISDKNYVFNLKKAYTSNKISPFNSQNTIISRKALKNYFLFPHIGRMDDIWASYYLQAKGFKVVFDKPSVKQIRNQHDIIKDFQEEIIGYYNNLKLIKSLKKDSENIKKFLPKNSYNAFIQYKKNFF